MPAEIVMVVEDQDARRGAVRFAIEPCSRQPADAAANHDQIEALVDCEARSVERLAFATDLMGNLERTGMASSQASQRRRIIAIGLSAQLSERTHSGGDRERRAVQKVAPGDRAGHVFLEKGGCGSFVWYGIFARAAAPPSILPIRDGTYMLCAD